MMAALCAPPLAASAPLLLPAPHAPDAFAIRHHGAYMHNNELRKSRPLIIGSTYVTPWVRLGAKHWRRWQRESPQTIKTQQALSTSHVQNHLV